MKKITLFTLFMITLLSLSCSNDSTYEATSSINIENEIVEKHFFTYKNQILTISLTKDEKSGEFVPIEDDSFQLLNEINEKNKSLITYVLDSLNFILFDNDIDLSKYLKKGINNKSNYSKSISTTPYDDPNSLAIYKDSNFNAQIYWWSGLDNSGYGNNLYGCYFANADNENRLKDFATTSKWEVLQATTLVLCNYNNNAIGNNPNDRTSSVRVSNCYARFYENSYYGGRSFVLDARNGVFLQIYNLKDLRRASWGRNWNDEISSVSLSY